MNFSRTMFDFSMRGTVRPPNGLISAAICTLCTGHTPLVQRARRFRQVGTAAFEHLRRARRRIHGRFHEQIEHSVRVGLRLLFVTLAVFTTRTGPHSRYEEATPTHCHSRGLREARAPPKSFRRSTIQTKRSFPAR
jgi:hypothetical protein